MAVPRALISLLILFSIGNVAHAAPPSFPAGFAPGAVWLSQSAPIAGTGVRLYSVVYNSSPTAIEGTVSFTAGSSVVGSAPFSLEAGESSIVSVVWITTEGAYQIAAAIINAVEKETKKPIDIGQTSTTALAVSVLPPTPEPEASVALGTARSMVASSTPVVATVVSSATAVTESIRKAGESYLATLAGEPTKTDTVASSTPRTTVLGAQIEVPEEEVFVPTETGLMQKIAKILLPLFRYPALFYPVFLVLILFVFWLVSKHLRSPKKRR